MTKRSEPAIAIVGITLPDHPGFGPIAELSLRLQTLKVIALADSAYGDVVVTALNAGAATRANRTSADLP